MYTRSRHSALRYDQAVTRPSEESLQGLDLWFERLGDEAVHQAARNAGGFGIAPFGMHPPGIGGQGKVLPLERIIVSKRSANRPKDIAALPALEATLRARDAS